jgi:hypothetical protein
LYGKLTVNLGVYVPEVALATGIEPRSFVQEYDCCVRARLGEIGPEHRDLWWEMDRVDDLAAEVWERLERDAFPFFARFESRDAILREWLRKAKVAFTGGPPRVVCAVILAARGEHGEARSLLADQVRESPHHPHHQEYVRGLATKLGLGILEV